VKGGHLAGTDKLKRGVLLGRGLLVGLSKTYLKKGKGVSQTEGKGQGNYLSDNGSKHGRVLVIIGINGRGIGAKASTPKG